MSPGQINTPYSKVATTVTDGGTTETVVLTIGGVNCDDPQYGVAISGLLQVTPASSGTSALVIKCRRGTTNAGTQVGSSLTQATTTFTAHVVPFIFIDTPGAIFNANYVITLTETGASGTGVVNYVIAQLIVSSFT